MYHYVDQPKPLQLMNQWLNQQTLMIQLMEYDPSLEDRYKQSIHMDPSHESNKTHQGLCQSMTGTHLPDAD